MSLTRGGGPLVAKDPPPSNYEIDGPAHRILWGTFPRRVRGVFAEKTIFDTTAGRLLHESQILPVLYVPEADVATELLVPTDTSTYCPFKGDASYWSVKVGGRISDDAAWAYLEPNPESEWLRGHYAFYWDRLDAWFDEDEEVFKHLRDPYHRVDVRRSSRPVTVSAGGETIAESQSAMVLSETGVPNRFYFPMDDVRRDVLEPTDESTHCSYKGDARFWSVKVDGKTLENAVFAYTDPFDDARRVAGYVSFLHDEINVSTKEQQ
jgi:uncharacterized protein (DUF427 family)